MLFDRPGKRAGHAHNLAKAGVCMNEVRQAFCDEQVMLAGAGHHEQDVTRSKRAAGKCQPVHSSKGQVMVDVAVAQSVALRPTWLLADARQCAGDQADTIDAMFGAGAVQPKRCADEFSCCLRQRRTLHGHCGRG